MLGKCLNSLPQPLVPAVIASLLLSLTCPAFTQAETFFVSSDSTAEFSTIQAALAYAAAADSVLVYPGRYLENITFLGKPIFLGSVSGASQTTIDGSLGGSCVQFRNGESRGACLKGFTVVNGSGSQVLPGGQSGFGGGILIVDSEPTILNNIIEGNNAQSSTQSGGGGGIWCVATTLDAVWSPCITGNIIRSNTSQLIGGGIGFSGNMTPLITANNLYDNEVLLGDGGGIGGLQRLSGLVITGNTITHNTAGDHGGGVYVAASGIVEPITIDISWNAVGGNIAFARASTGTSGGGLWLGYTNAIVRNNTFALNRGYGLLNNWGGSIVLVQSGSPVVERNIIANSLEGVVYSVMRR